MSTYKHIAILGAILSFAAGCGQQEPLRTYDVRIKNVATYNSDNTREIRGEISFHRDGRDTSANFAVRMTTSLKGPQWKIETRTSDGQRVLLEHDDDLRRALITIDDNTPVEVRERPDRMYEYKHDQYQKKDIGALAEAIADDLEAKRTSDESVLSTFEAGHIAMKAAGRGDRKLFFTFAFIDIFTEVQAAMNIGANNTIIQE